MALQILSTLTAMITCITEQYSNSPNEETLFKGMLQQFSIARLLSWRTHTYGKQLVKMMQQRLRDPNI